MKVNNDTITRYGDDELAKDVLQSKYLADGEEHPYDIWERVAGAVGSVEKDVKILYQKLFYGLLEDWKFVPGGRIMHGAGREEAKRKPSLSNCYVIPITEDSLEGIYRCLSESAMVYRTGGGVGTDLSILRPRGASVNATIDASPGVTAFMNLFSESTNAVSQSGRRGALMLTLRVDHPDIEEFIRIKSDLGRTKVQYANISVLLTDEFMEAVDKDDPFDLRWNGDVFRTVRAKALWNKIIALAHATAEPGLIFWDRMKAYHNVEYVNPLESTNPCGEQPLASYTACNLGNINVSKYVEINGDFKSEEFCRDVATAVRFLDNVITYNEKNHALGKITESVNKDRRVGLGITGLADMLVKMKIKYDSEKAIRHVAAIMHEMRNSAYLASIELAKERGAFPDFDNDRMGESLFIQSLSEEMQNKIKKHGLRNSTLLTCPPVGTGSIVAQCSSGIEPIFATSYHRRVKQEDGETFEDYKVYHPLIKDLFGDDENLPKYVVTAHDIDPFFRVKMQATIQKYVDTSISSTINLPEDVTVETVSDIYKEAYKQGLKGVTVYREGSREGVLQTETYAEGHEKQPTGIKPRQRPDVTVGTTERIETGEGKLYVTINEDDEGIAEVFATIGKAGGHAQSYSESICRLISLGLRSGVDVTEVIDSLKGISGPVPLWTNGEQILSMADGIGKALERYLVREKGVEVTEEKKMAGACSECGCLLVHQSGCETCLDCGYSRCS